MEYNQIVWIASYPKSGSTWIRCFLDAYLLQEVDINQIVCSISDDVATMHLVGDGSDPREYPVEIQMLCRPMALLRLVRRYHDNKIDGVPLFVKTHQPNVVANGIELLPYHLTKAVVFLYRDPRDVVLSFSKHMGIDVDAGITKMQDKYLVLQAKGANKLTDLLTTWDKHSTSYLNSASHNVLPVRYEDLMKDPVKWFSLILKHSGITPEEDKVKAALDMVDIERLREHEKKAGFVESSPFAKNQFFGKGGSQWKETLTPKQVHVINKRFGSVMKRAGYLRSKVA